MAYKFVDADQLNSDLTAVGNAIRTKGGTSAKLAFPSEMVSAIGAISTGVELNYKVVGGTSAPASPSLNTIWVNTSVNITSHVFSTGRPTAFEGRVWFSTGTTSNVSFNALKTNGIYLYPFSAKQYVNGAWADKTAKSYIGGKWVDWWNGELYENGNEFENYTGGWSSAGYTIKGSSGSSYTVEDGTKTEDYMQIQHSSNSINYMLGTQQKVNFSGFKTLEVTCEKQSGVEMYVVLPSEKSVTVGTTTPSVTMSNSGIATLDVSTVGSAYIALVPRLNGSNIPIWRITKVRMIR